MAERIEDAAVVGQRFEELTLATGLGDSTVEKGVERGDLFAVHPFMFQDYGVERAVFSQDPGLKRGDELILSDVVVLEGEHAEEEISVSVGSGTHGETTPRPGDKDLA